MYQQTYQHNEYRSQNAIVSSPTRKESKKVTILVLDKSNKIVRAIAPDELENFQTCNLLSLFE